MNVNITVIAGNLTRDPEIKQIGGSGKTLAKFSLACNRKYTRTDGERCEETTYVDVECWGRTAELVGQYLKCGSGALIEGRLKQDRWEDADGNKRSRLSVVADRVTFMGSAEDRSNNAPRKQDQAPIAQPSNAPPPPPADLGDDEPPF